MRLELQPKGGGQSVHVVERWTDLERRINGRWVYLLDHTTLVPKEGPLRPRFFRETPSPGGDAGRGAG